MSANDTTSNETTPEDEDFCTVEFPTAGGGTTLLGQSSHLSSSTKESEPDGKVSDMNCDPGGGLLIDDKVTMATAEDKDSELDTKEPNGNCATESDTKVEMWLCPHCPEKTFPGRRQWKFHMNRHKFKCPYCDKGFTRPQDVRTHVRRHTGEKPFKCDVCSKGFVSRQDLKRHVVLHTDEYQYVCDKCDEKFKHRTSWMNHQRKHTGNMFQCEFCVKKFVSKHHLEEHRRLHTGEKPFKCPELGCGKIFATQSGVKSHHTFVHSQDKNRFVCEICGKGFVMKGNYTVHYRTHTGETPYGCKICGNLFKSRAQRRQHEMTHVEGKCFVCQLCSKGFNRKHRLTEHMKRHHDGVMASEPQPIEISFTSWDDAVDDTKHVNVAGDEPAAATELKPLHDGRKLKPVDVSKIKVELDEVIQEQKQKASGSVAIKLSDESGGFLTKDGVIYAMNYRTGEMQQAGEDLRRNNNKPSPSERLPEMERNDEDNTGAWSPSSGSVENDTIEHVDDANDIKDGSEKCKKNKHKRKKPPEVQSKVDGPPKKKKKKKHKKSHRPDSSPASKQETNKPKKKQKSQQTSMSTPQEPLKKQETPHQISLPSQNLPVASAENKQRKPKRRKPQHLVCPLCDKVFTHTNSFKMHLKRHRGEKTEKCTYCDKSFVAVTDRRIHERVHTGLTPYQCDKCPKKFKYRTSFYNHKRTHTGETFDCDTCGKKCVSTVQLETHLRSHTGEKPWQCEVCGKVYGSLAGYRMHKLKHTGEQGSYVCDICGKCFPCSSNLKQHCRVHTGSKPYPCGMCGKGFKTRAHQLNHEQVHAEVKAFACRFCRKGFGRKDRLKTHEQKCKLVDGDSVAFQLVIGNDEPDAGLVDDIAGGRGDDEPINMTAIKNDERILGYSHPAVHKTSTGVFPLVRPLPPAMPLADVVRDLSGDLPMQRPILVAPARDHHHQLVGMMHPSMVSQRSSTGHHEDYVTLML